MPEMPIYMLVDIYDAVVGLIVEEGWVDVGDGKCCGGEIDCWCCYDVVVIGLHVGRTRVYERGG